MSERTTYPHGVPCWVEVLAPDPQAALDFYGPLFGWAFDGPGPMPGEGNAYFVARNDGRDVAGICSLPDGQTHAAWTTYVRVANVEASVEAARAAGGTIIEGPVDAPPAGRLAVIADPSNAVFCLWEAGIREGAQLVNEPGAWALSALHTDQPERAKQFYGAVFGWNCEPFNLGGNEITLLRLPGYVGGEPQQPVPRDVVGVLLPLAQNGSPPHWSVDLWVADADAAALRAENLGGKVLVQPHDTPGFRSAVIADPGGAVFSISQLKVP